MAVNEMQSCHLYSTYFAPRGRDRMFQLGIQLAQLYLSPFDLLIGVIGEAGSGKSMLIKGMFPGLELTNDDAGVNIRPLPLLNQGDENRFFEPHTYHVDIRFEMGFENMNELAEAILTAIHRGKRVVVEHFDLVYPHLGINANLLIGVGEQVVITRPNLFGPEPQMIYDISYRSLNYRLMAHTAEDLCEMFMPPELMGDLVHGDVRHGFLLSFPEEVSPDVIRELERKVNDAIDNDLKVSYVDDGHVRIGDTIHPCTGPRTHVRTTGKIEGFRLKQRCIYDRFSNRYLLAGAVGEDSEENLGKLARHYPAGV